MTDHEGEHTPPPIMVPQTEGERIAVIEADIRSILFRLGQGAESIAEIRDGFNAMNDAAGLAAQEARTKLSHEVDAVLERVETVKTELTPRPAPMSKVALALLPIVLFVGTIIWTASRYPERSEFLDLQRKTIELDVGHRVFEVEIRYRLQRLEDRRP